jgi:hypothetical protein
MAPEWQDILTSTSSLPAHQGTLILDLQGEYLTSIGDFTGSTYSTLGRTYLSLLYEAQSLLNHTDHATESFQKISINYCTYTIEITRMDKCIIIVKIGQ